MTRRRGQQRACDGWSNLCSLTEYANQPKPVSDMQLHQPQPIENVVQHTANYRHRPHRAVELPLARRGEGVGGSGGTPKYINNVAISALFKRARWLNRPATQSGYVTPWPAELGSEPNSGWLRWLKQSCWAELGSDPKSATVLTKWMHFEMQAGGFWHGMFIRRPAAHRCGRRSQSRLC